MNWTAILVASIVPLVVGFIWYGYLFKEAWMKFSGVTMEKAKEGYAPWLLMTVTYLLSIFTAVGLWKQIVGLHTYVNSLRGGDGVISEHPFFHGMLHGFQDAFLFGAIPVLIINSLYDLRGWQYILINVGYWILTISLMGGVVGAFG